MRSLKWQSLDNYSRYLVHEDGKVFDTNLGKLIPSQIVSSGYHLITLRSDEGKRKTFRLHRLVAMVFIPNPENKPEVNHDDGNKSNNKKSNLVWHTHSENMKHAWDNDLVKGCSHKMRGLG